MSHTAGIRKWNSGMDLLKEVVIELYHYSEVKIEALQNLLRNYRCGLRRHLRCAPIHSGICYK